ncbi:MAG: beta-ketoacyl-ACP synthase II [Verrucomicrobiota bacterium]
MSSQRRVVITGMGAVTPLGLDLHSLWKNLTHGVSGIGRVSQFDITGYDCQIAGEVPNFDPAQFFKNPKDIRRADRFSQLAIAAAKMAHDHSGLADLPNPDRYGVIIGSGIGGLKTLEDQHANLLSKGPGRVSPFTIPMMIANMASGLISIEFGWSGPNFAPVSACATACHAIGEAWRMIREDDADAFLAGGSEATIVPMGMAGFAAMRAMSTRNNDPTKASRPFDRDRDGFVMSEGAGVVVLEELEHAKRRGAHIYAELLGYGLTSDAYHMTSPNPQGTGAARCMRMALKKAGLNPQDVDYINMHGTSTPVGDLCETKAVKEVFGERSTNGLVVSSTKSMTGHLLGAAGAVETIACVMTIQNQLIPPTINLDNPSPDCDLDYVPHVAREKKVRVAMNNSFGFGGHNATLVVQEFPG